MDGIAIEPLTFSNLKKTVTSLLQMLLYGVQDPLVRSFIKDVFGLELVVQTSADIDVWFAL